MQKLKDDSSSLSYQNNKKLFKLKMRKLTCCYNKKKRGD